MQHHRSTSFKFPSYMSVGSSFHSFTRPFRLASFGQPGQVVESRDTESAPRSTGSINRWKLQTQVTPLMQSSLDGTAGGQPPPEMCSQDMQGACNTGGAVSSMKGSPCRSLDGNIALRPGTIHSVRWQSQSGRLRNRLAMKQSCSCDSLPSARKQSNSCSSLPSALQQSGFCGGMQSAMKKSNSCSSLPSAMKQSGFINSLLPPTVSSCAGCPSSPPHAWSRKHSRKWRMHSRGWRIAPSGASALCLDDHSDAAEEKVQLAGLARTHSGLHGLFGDSIPTSKLKLIDAVVGTVMLDFGRYCEHCRNSNCRSHGCGSCCGLDRPSFSLRRSGSHSSGTAAGTEAAGVQPPGFVATQEHHDCTGTLKGSCESKQAGKARVLEKGFLAQCLHFQGIRAANAAAVAVLQGSTGRQPGKRTLLRLSMMLLLRDCVDQSICDIVLMKEQAEQYSQTCQVAGGLLASFLDLCKWEALDIT